MAEVVVIEFSAPDAVGIYHRVNTMVAQPTRIEWFAGIADIHRH